MNAGPRRIWRPLRSFLILVCVAGAVLAADNTWLTDLRFDFNAPDWWSNISPAQAPSADIALVSGPATHRAPELSMGQLLHGLLFSKPSNGWRLEPEKTDVTSAWMTQQSGGTFASLSRSDYFQPSFFTSGYVGYSSAAVGPVPQAPTASGIWNKDGPFGDWSLPANWSGGIIADGAGNAAHFDMFNLTADINVTLDSSRTIGQLYIGDTDGTNHYTFPASAVTSITFDGVSNTALLEQTATSAGDTMAIGLFVKTDLAINNRSVTNPFTIASPISSTAATGTLQNITFNSGVATPGVIKMDGNITDGVTGATVQVQISGGRVEFRGDNTYSGATFVSGGGALMEFGDNSGATGTVFVSGAGSLLGGKGSIGGNVFMFGGSTITANETTGTGTLTLNQSLFMSTEGQGATYLANINGATSDLLLIGQTMVLGLGTTLDIEGAADGMTTYTLAMFASRSGEFETVMNIPTGYSLVYNSTDIELVPVAIPEPSTWFGAALALSAVAFAMRRRLRSYWLSVIG
jgi:autotransporter-associated beta strand protein